jgi:hypothetical protein
MCRAGRYLSSLFLIVTLSAPAFITGCAARAEYGVRIYDRDHHDYHRWDNREDQAYRRYLRERREDYRDFSRLNGNEQNDYWNWRHNHPDSDDH